MTNRFMFASLALCLFAGTASAEDKPANTTPKCRAIDNDGKQVVEVEEGSAPKCASKLMDAVRAVKCTADMKGKKFEYTVSSDHMAGKQRLKDRKTSLTCVRVNAK